MRGLSPRSYHAHFWPRLSSLSAPRATKGCQAQNLACMGGCHPLALALAALSDLASAPPRTVVA